MKKILVIGGAGFIGSNLCEYFINIGCEVTSIDCYFTGSLDNHIDGVRYITGYAKDIDKLLDKTDKFDIVYHFGEYSRVEQSFEDVGDVFELNNQLIHVLNWCKKTSTKIVYSGSSTKFVDGVGGKLCPYAWIKSSNTELLKSYADWFGIDYAIVYFYNVYGPREIQDGKYSTLIAKFINKRLCGENLTVVLPGTQERNFTYVGDVVSALHLVGERGVGDMYGIGNPKSISVIEVAEMIGGDIDFMPTRPGNRLSASCIIDKTLDLGWEPKVELRDYINEVLG